MINKNLIKRLSHPSEREVRDQAFMELEEMIQDNKIQFDDLELKAIFEGIFWCLWFADKPAYVDDLLSRIVQFTNDIENEKHKLMWIKSFFKSLTAHFGSHDMNDLMRLLRMQLGCIFKHCIQSKKIKKYLKIIFTETLSNENSSVEVGMHIADIYLEELINNFDQEKLTHKQLTILLNPFLECLEKTTQSTLFRRVKEKVFEQLIEKATESENYFPMFNVKKYGEEIIFPVASGESTLESRRDGIYELYDKAIGKQKEDEEELSYAQRLEQIQMAAMSNLQVHTKHQKKKLIREKVKKANKIKKRIIKMIRKQQEEVLSKTSEDKAAASTPKVVDSSAVEESKSTPAPSATAVQEDTVVELTKKATKKRKKPKVKEDKKKSGRKVLFKLEKNEIFNF
ncbi:unnamed protein product [Moneuplotes crassus]|uniref:Nucleolar protein n=2 Tax=Euplotes crassus TaxID=5936 RepID=A0AAD1U7N3_EUPCR|nr:unnamed protein product [Moneuplotes crassus]